MKDRAYTDEELKPEWRQAAEREREDREQAREYEKRLQEQEDLVTLEGIEDQQQGVDEQRDLKYDIPDNHKVLIATPNYTNLFTAEVHRNHVNCVASWKKWGIDFNWMIIGRTFVHFARSQACQAAIDGKFTHIFWLDDDAVIDPEILPRYMMHDKDIMITPYPMRKSPFQIGVLSSIVYNCRDCKGLFSVGIDVTPPIQEKCPQCGHITPRDFHSHKAYRNFTLKDLNQGLVQVDGGGTHAMLVKTEALRVSHGHPLPKYGETLKHDQRSYPDGVVELLQEFEKMADTEKKRQLIEHYLGDVPDQSLSFEEEANEKHGLKPYFVMPKAGTEDMLFSYRAKCKGLEVWCDTDRWADHVGFAPVITKGFTESAEKQGFLPPPKPGAVALVQVGDHGRDHQVMHRDSQTTLA